MTYTDDVKRYLADNYQATTEQIDAALADPEVQADLAKYERQGSYPYYPGNLIAEGCGWPEIPESDKRADAYEGHPPEDDDDDDDEGW